MRNRGFEIIEAYADCGIELPSRKTGGSAGYDLMAAEDAELAPGEMAIVPTGLKCFMQPDEALMIYIRSGLSVKHHLMLMNQVRVIDSDYYNNPENEGQIRIALMNLGKETFRVKKGMRIAQGIFTRYLTADGDLAGRGETRRGGFGSTGA